jgi:hypothetical protein
MSKKHGSAPELAPYVVKVSAIHAKAVALLTASNVHSILQIGEILEDTANELMNVSEEIRLTVLATNHPKESEQVSFRIVTGSRC